MRFWQQPSSDNYLLCVRNWNKWCTLSKGNRKRSTNIFCYMEQACHHGLYCHTTSQLHSHGCDNEGLKGPENCVRKACYGGGKISKPILTVLLRHPHAHLKHTNTLKKFPSGKRTNLGKERLIWKYGWRYLNSFMLSHLFLKGRECLFKPLLLHLDLSDTFFQGVQSSAYGLIYIIPMLNLGSRLFLPKMLHS